MLLLPSYTTPWDAAPQGVAGVVLNYIGANLMNGIVGLLLKYQFLITSNGKMCMLPLAHYRLIALDWQTLAWGVIGCLCIIWLPNES